jgi:hypothetical protein
MANPFLKKNPFMSLWLSGANRVAGSARGQVAAEAKRQAALATRKVSSDLVKIWAGAATTALAPVQVPARKRKKPRK